jgi:hypothetical protein
VVSKLKSNTIEITKVKKAKKIEEVLTKNSLLGKNNKIRPPNIGVQINIESIGMLEIIEYN